MKKKYRFVGTLSTVGDVKLDAFGQSVELDPAVAKHPRGPAVIPDDVFRKIGFTDQELAAYKYAGPRMEAPPEFQAKYRKALAVVREYRTGGDE